MIRSVSIAVVCGMVTLPAQVARPAQHASVAREGWRTVGDFPLQRGLWLSQITALGRDDVWAFGGGGDIGTKLGPLAFRWNGRSWERVALPGRYTGEVTDAQASSPRNLWVVGRSTHHAFVMRWNGRSWTAVRRWRTKGRWPAGGSEAQVATFGPKDVWVFGLAEGTVHYDGKRWRTFRAGSGIIHAGAISATNIWGVEKGREDRDSDGLLHFDGSQWIKVRPDAIPPVPSGGDDLLRLTRVYARGERDVWVAGEIWTGVGYYGADVEQMGTRKPILLHWDGLRWTREVIPGAEEVGDTIAPDGAGGLWVTAFQDDLPIVTHRSATGAWSTTTMDTRHGRVVLGDLTPIPGTSSSWGVGWFMADDGAGAFSLEP